MEEQSTLPKFAVLIDGDNAQASLLPQILAEVSKVGLITIKRIYGDWTTTNMNQWKDSLHKYAIQPVQQFRNTVGKNATDSAMIIDAMDLLHSNDLQGFCIVSSDSDYTRLATRIREIGVFVMGIGKRLTPKAFVNACNVFIFTENLDIKEKPAASKGKRTAKQTTAREEKKKFDPLPLLKGAFDMAIQEDGWANIATMGFYLRQLDPSFDPRTYGHKQLSQLLKSQSKIFDMRFQETPGSTDIYVRLKD